MLHRSPPASRQPAAWKTPRQKPLDLLFRSVAQRLRDHVLNAGFDTLARQHGDDEQLALLDVIHKAAITPATTTGVTGIPTNPWAAELVGVVISQWSSSLNPSVFSQLVDAPTLALDYAEGGALRVPSRTATPTVNGSFVGEGQPIPTRRFGLNSTPLPAKKVGVIVPFTRELAKSSPLNVEAIVRAEITADTARGGRCGACWMPPLPTASGRRLARWRNRIDAECGGHAERKDGGRREGAACRHRARQPCRVDPQSDAGHRLAFALRRRRADHVDLGQPSAGHADCAGFGQFRQRVIVADVQFQRGSGRA